MQTQAIVIGEATIQQDPDGRYSLNDLHRAAGGEAKHQPSNFLRTESTRAIVSELEQSSEMRSAPVEVLNGGPERGTYVCRELVYAYAMWVSPAFHLKVIRVFDALASGRVTVAPLALPSGLEEKVAGHFALMKHLSLVPGVRAGIAASVVLDAIHTDTGLTTEPYRKALPPGEGPAASMNPTALGKVLGLSAPKANALLASKGLQKKNARCEWELTEEGQKVAEAIPYTRGSHSGYQLLWRPEVLGLLK